jgi:hypothetical protein
MKAQICLLPLLALLLGAQATQAPDTPAGRQVQAWPTAFNSGDRATLQKYWEAAIPVDPISSRIFRRPVSITRDKQ